MKQVIKKNYIILILLFCVLTIPFSNSDYFDNVSPEKITSDLAFYEINTCSISLVEFLIKNPNVIYQDHYVIKANNYSAIKCFGTITGIDQIGHIFYISIGTNTIVNLFNNSILLFLILYSIKSNKLMSLKFKEILSIILSSGIACLMVYSEKRFYSTQIFFLDTTQYKTYAYLFIYIFTISLFLYSVTISLDKKLINLLPYLYLFMGLSSGLNFYFIALIFVPIGIHQILINKNFRKLFIPLNFLIFFWSYAGVGNLHYLDPDKIRGLSTTSYNFLSLLSGSYFFLFLISGIIIYFKQYQKTFNFKLFTSNSLISTSILFVLSYLSSSMPFINFYSYYYFGLTKFPTNNQSLFSFNEWGEKVPWRGLFPSAETSGEFYALAIICTILFMIDEKKINLRFSIFLIFPILGLYASNNKAATVSIVIIIFLKLIYEYQVNSKIKFIFIFVVLSLFILFVRLENILYSFNFSSNQLLAFANSYSLDLNNSSAVQYLNNQSNILSKALFVPSILIFFINRSELWGIFLSRYNPDILEFLFGTGPFNFSRYFSEIDILSYRVGTGNQLGLLLPHSSLLNLLLFFGLFGVVIYFGLIIFTLKNMRNYQGNLQLIAFFILLNILKSDSILYLPSLVNYLMLLTISFKNSKLIKPLY